MIHVNDLSARELAALLHFHADAGVDWLLEDTPQDRIAEFAAAAAARQEAMASARPAAQAARNQAQATATGASTARKPAPSPIPGALATVPDAEAVAAARNAAASATTLDELRTILRDFSGCNLRNSARSTVLPGGNTSSEILVIGPMPDGDDDRDGEVFSGRTGQLLDRMLAAISLDREQVGLAHILPWRPPGNRQPSVPETDICRPFLERHIALSSPKSLLLLGNFTARFFFGGSGTIHSLRGQWRDVDVAGATIPALATFHPQDLLNAPANKALAWQDLLQFGDRMAR